MFIILLSFLSSGTRFVGGARKLEERFGPNGRPELDRICGCLSVASLFGRSFCTTTTDFAMPNARVLRDIKARHGVRANEIARRAYLYVSRNETLSPQVRHHA